MLCAKDAGATSPPRLPLPAADWALALCVQPHLTSALVPSPCPGINLASVRPRFGSAGGAAPAACEAARLRIR